MVCGIDILCCGEAFLARGKRITDLEIFRTLSDFMKVQRFVELDPDPESETQSGTEPETELEPETEP